MGRRDRSRLREPLVVLLALSILFFVVTVLQEKNVFEDGIYAHYTSSILEDGDFNIVNQRIGDPLNWVVTPMGNDGSFKPVGTSVFLSPFFAYRYAIDWIAGAKSRGDQLRFLHVYVLGTLFYVVLGLIALWRALDFLRIPHFRKAMLLGGLSTAFVWYVFVETTATNVFSLAYSALAFAYFALLGKDRASAGQLAVLGVAFGLGTAIRAELFWIGLIPVALLLGGRVGRNGLLAFLGGAGLPLALMLLNSSMRGGLAGSLASPYQFFYSPLALAWASLKYELVGPNGYFSTSPIYVLAGLALPGVLARGLPPCRAFWIVLAAPILVVLGYASLGAVMDCLSGRHLLSFYFLLVLLLAGGLKRLEERSPGWLAAGLFAAAVATAWNLFVVLCFVDGGSSNIKWTNGGQLGWSNALTGVSLLASRASTQSLQALRAVAIHLPLLAAMVPALLLLSRAQPGALRRLIGRFFVGGAAVFAVFSGLNAFRHEANVERHLRAGIYQDLVVARARDFADYDGWVEHSHLTISYFLQVARCDLAELAIADLRKYLEYARTGALMDPIGFSRDLDTGVVRGSAYDAPGTFELLRDGLREKCGLSLPYRGYRRVR